MMPVSAIHVVLTLLAGVATGVLSASFGVGGAVISTPAIRALGVSALFAVGTTLPSILPSAVSGTARYLREDLIVWRVVAWSAPAGVAAAVGGSFLSHAVPGHGHWLMILTAALLGITSYRIGRAARTAGPPADEPLAESDAEMAPPAAPFFAGESVESTDLPAKNEAGRTRPAVLVAIGVAAGLLSGLLGVGGGVILVPGFTEVVRLPLKTAIATSLVCVGIFAVPGTLTHWGLHDIDWLTAGLLSVGVIPGARLGAAAAIKASDARLRLTVAMFLGLTAVVYAGGELAALMR
jgi:uncharacterized membrane protein YfcA